MIKFIGITDIIDFDKDYKEDWTTEIRIALKVTDKDIIKKAKKIDKEYYNKKCFGLNFNYYIILVCKFFKCFSYLINNYCRNFLFIFTCF